MRTRIARGAGIVLFSVLALTGCSAVEAEFGGGEQSEAPASEAPASESSATPKDNPLLDEVWITLSDGRRVVCVRNNAVREGGLSCDWDSAAVPADSAEPSDGGE